MPEVESDGFLGSPNPCISLNHSTQRKTSNFFPTSSAGDTSMSSMSLASNLNLSSTSNSSNPFQFTKRHNSSPLIGGNGTSKFFNNGIDPLSPINLSTSTTTTTPIGLSNTCGLLRLGIGLGDELSNNINNLNLSSSPHTVTTNLLSISSETISSVPSLQSSIWNDSKITTPKLNKLDEEIGNGFLFSPFMSNDLGDFSQPTTSHKSRSLGTKAYSSKINSSPFTPSFEYNFGQPKDSVYTSLNSTRDIINNKKQLITHKRPVLQEDEDLLNTKLKKLDERRFGLIKQNCHLMQEPINKENIVINLPKKINTISESNYFIDQISNNGYKKYHEDYCSTFYKRNSHGYMFVKEPANSLKVNTTGLKSWVQLKIKLHNSSSSDISIKKLKVDIKQLPIWKPINLNSNVGYGAKKFNKKSNASNKDLKKYPHTNLSKRFGKKE